MRLLLFRIRCHTMFELTDNVKIYTRRLFLTKQTTVVYKSVLSCLAMNESNIRANEQ